jgi:VCBS repeat-containing protein
MVQIKGYTIESGADLNGADLSLAGLAYTDLSGAVLSDANIFGPTAGAVTEDTGSVLTTSGALPITDVDTGEDVFVAQTSTTGDAGLGMFTLGTDGAWAYTADNMQSAIQALGVGATTRDTFTAAAADGTTQVISVTITGVKNAASTAITLSGDKSISEAATSLVIGTLTTTECGSTWWYYGRCSLDPLVHSWSISGSRNRTWSAMCCSSVYLPQPNPRSSGLGKFF